MNKSHRMKQEINRHNIPKTKFYFAQEVLAGYYQIFIQNLSQLCPT